MLANGKDEQPIELQNRVVRHQITTKVTQECYVMHNLVMFCNVHCVSTNGDNRPKAREQFEPNFVYFQDLDGELKEHSGPKRVGNPLSRLTFWPATSIITAGAKKPIKHHQLWKVDEHCRAHTTWKKVKRLWKEELEIQR